MLGMILKGYPRISETFISNEIELLEQKGASIRIFSMRQPRESIAHPSIGRIRAPADYLPETLLKPLPLFLFHCGRLAARRPEAFAAAWGLATRRFTRSRRMATFKHFFQAAYLVDRLLPGGAVAHWHAHFAHSPTSVAFFASRLSGLPFSFTAHAKDIYTSRPDQLADKIEAARFVVTCTRYNRGHLVSLSPKSFNKIHCIYHGIDLRLFGTDGGQSPPAAPFNILTVARLTPKKGIPTVLKALALLRDQGLAFSYTLIGDGDDRSEIAALVKRLKMGDRVFLLGTRPHPAVLDHYRRAAVFVLGCEVAPNGDRDGIPNVVAESMAMGVPVVATRVSALPEIIGDDAGGLLVPPKNPSAMAGAIRRLLEDQMLRSRLVANGRQRVRERFDNRFWIGKLAALFQQEGLMPDKTD
jgi:glycosyltransferase involved in cell wall biosynthesis